VPELAQLSLRERGKQQRIEKILIAARDLLLEEPDRAITLQRIAERADVAPMTVTNLVGNRDDIWGALANRALAPLDAIDLSDGTPLQRARRIANALMQIITREAPVFRALISGWRDSGRVLDREPTRAIIHCLHEARDDGAIAADVDVRRLGQIIFTGFVGAVHQWAAGLLSDHALRTRARDIIDTAFAAARPPGAEPDWNIRTNAPR
jgi:AcrR family transcriptional regulator